MADIQSRLEKEFCPPIDSSLFSAILSDYDLSSSTSLSELHATLDILRDSALAEESTTFDPSGSSGIRDESSSPESSERARSWHGDATSTATEETDLTGLSQGLGAIDLVETRNNAEVDLERQRHEAELAELPPESKEKILKEMFPEAKAFDIQYTLRKAHNNFGKTVEELLNQNFLDGEELNGGIDLKKQGVEAFTEPAINGRGRRGRKKQKQLLRRTSSTPASNIDDVRNKPVLRSRWDCAKEDVAFIAQRTYISPQIITSIYHKSGASLPATIATMCDSISQDLEANPYLADASSAMLETHVAELATDFPHLTSPQHTALIALAHPSTASAHELARALSSKSMLESAAILPQYLPRPPSPISISRSPSSTDPSLPLSQSTAASLALARSNAFTQAQSAYRKSKSKPLMGGAAAYYSSIGRNASASLRRHEAAAAEALVTSQSKPGEIDLHGVTVKDAVNIARARVEAWWEQEGREWARQGKVMGNGLRVITGAGRHSEGGRGKLGPAVGGILVREGWKVEVGDGVIEVVGRARK